MPKYEMLDLDALYGTDNPIVVKWQGAEYVLPVADALDPVGLAKLTKLQSRFEGLRSNMTEESALELQSVVDEMLRGVCPAFVAANPPFIVKMRALLYWSQQLEERSKNVIVPSPAAGGTPTAS